MSPSSVTILLLRHKTEKAKIEIDNILPEMGIYADLPVIREIITVNIIVLYDENELDYQLYKLQFVFPSQ
jgi:hypothetical protein